MFYYRKGNISTTDPWNRPSAEAFDKWLDEWSKIPHVHEYSVYLTGAFCQNYFFNRTIPTWDADVFLIQNPKLNINYYNLKHILEEGVKIGFKNRLLIDIYLAADCPTNEKFSDRKICAFKDIHKESDAECWQWDLKGEITELIPGLYQAIKDPYVQYNKYISKDYNVPCKQVNLPNNEY